MAKKYFNINYLYQGRWISYWYQIKEVVFSNTRSVLEIGPGNKIVSNALKEMGIEVMTMDIDSETNPDFIDNILNPKTIKENSFDAVLCCQVLEHLPYSDFLPALRNVYKITRKNVIISLPYTSKGTFRFKIYIPFCGKKFIKLFTLFPRKHIFNGQHYWEIGKKGYSLSKILNDIKKAGLQIKRHYPIFENPYHYMIVCEKEKFN